MFHDKASALAADDATVGDVASGRRHPHGARLTGPLIAVFLIGAGLQALSAYRLPISGDELNVVGIGRTLFETGQTIATLPGQDVTSHTPGGGFVQVVYGLPQLIRPGVPSGRSLSFLLMLTGALVLTLTLRSEVSPRFALWYLASYWIGPWTVYHGTMAWEPALIMALASVTFCACLRLRHRTSFRDSAFLGWSLIAAYQAYSSFAIVALAVAPLIWKRLIKLSLIGILLGLAIGSVTLWPWLFRRPLDPMGNAVSSSRRNAHLGRGLTDGSILRAAGFWLRMSSSDLNRQVRENRFYRTGANDTTLVKTVKRVAMPVILALSFLSVLVSLLANIWFLARRNAASGDRSMAWLRSYAFAMLAGLLIAAAASPVCIQGYHAVAALTGACVPLAAWFERTWENGSWAGRRLIAGLFVVRAAVVIIVALGRQL